MDPTAIVSYPESDDEQSMEEGTIEALRFQRISCSSQHIPHSGTQINLLESPNSHVGANIYLSPVTVVTAPEQDEAVQRKAMVVRWCGGRRARIIHGTGWCLLMIVVTVYIIVILTAAQPESPIDLGLNASWYKRRTEWQALNPAHINLLSLPVKKVLIGHTVSSSCYTVEACLRRVYDLQQQNIAGRRMADIAYNFLVGGDGTVIEGRGANVIGAHTYHQNSESIGIAFMGNYNLISPVQAQVEHLTELLQQLVKDNILSPDFKLYGVCQLSHLNSPGIHLMREVKKLPHWDHEYYEGR